LFIEKPNQDPKERGERAVGSKSLGKTATAKLARRSDKPLKLKSRKI